MNLIKPLSLEYDKIRNYRPFLVILGLYVLCFLVSGFYIKKLIDMIITSESDAELAIFKSFGVPLFDFIDIWQNLGWLAAVFKWIPAFIVIMSVTMEFSQKTMKQNIIDGLTKKEFLLSKIGLVTAISLASSILLLVLGLFLGYLYSPVTSMEYVLKNIVYVGAYGLEVFVFLCIALAFSFLLRRTGVTIILYLIYTACIEPFATAYMQYELKWPVWFYPVESANLLIRFPFGKYFLRDGQDLIMARDIITSIGWAGVFLFVCYLIMKKRDL